MTLQAVHLSSVGVRPLTVGLVFLVLATVAVLLRIVSARLSRRTLQPDDYMIVVALMLTYGCGISNVIGIVYGGIGHHIEDLTEPQAELFLKNLIPSILLWASSLTAVKISILLFYSRIFSIRSFRITAYTVMVIVILWWVSVVLEEFLLCRPLALNWDRKIRGGVCGDIMGAYIAAGVINLCTDLMVLILPVPTILRLKLPVRTKIALTFTMCLGFFVCIITAIRISAVVAYKPEDGTYSMWETAIWSQLEPTLGITCACIPLTRPLLDRFILRRKEATLKGSMHNTLSRQRTNFPQPVFSTADDLPLADFSSWVHHSRASEDGKEGVVTVRTDWDVRHS